MQINEEFGYRKDKDEVLKFISWWRVVQINLIFLNVKFTLLLYCKVMSSSKKKNRRLVRVMRSNHSK